ncbi:hypothetical protein X738_30165 [Mesorhizobium sp. LNHC209A00]|nr:hypothetical protein X738_30165 [Mesorhizobium sp. LNHC209A00]
MMGNVTTIGLDIAKSAFQIHGVDAASEVVVRRKLTRGRVMAFFESLPRVFQIHGVDAASEVVVRRKLTRGRVLAFFESLPRCLVGIEACSSSHYWARELTARGHDVRLLPARTCARS